MLRTCERIEAEGSEFYYGYNEWCFEETCGHVRALRFLENIGPTYTKWLRRLAINTPFMAEQIYYYTPHSIPYFARRKRHFAPRGDCILYHNLLHMCSEGATWGREFNKFTHALGQLPALREPDLVLKKSWRIRKDVEYIGEDLWEDRVLATYHDALWEALRDLTRARPFLNIQTVRPVWAIDGQKYLGMRLIGTASTSGS